MELNRSGETDPIRGSAQEDEGVGEATVTVVDEGGCQQPKTGWKAVFKAEFQKKNFWFSFSVVECFFRCQWTWPGLVLLLYRVSIAIYIWAWLIYSVVLMPTFPPAPKYGHVWPAFLTNWSFTVLAVYLTVAAVVLVRRTPWDRSILERPQPLPDHTTCAPCAEDGSPDPEAPLERPLPWDVKIEWCLFAIISNFVFIITLIYFGILYPRLVKEYDYTLKATDLHIHGLNSVVVLIEMFVAAYPVRLLHIIYPILYGLAYVLFSLFYYASDTTNRIVYQKVLDWRYPGPTIGVILGLALVVIPLFQLLLFGLYRLRMWIYKTYVLPWST